MALLAKSIGNLFGSMASSFGNSKVQLFQSEEVLNDDLTNKDDAVKYKLVMVGRAVSRQEQEADVYLGSVLGGEKHGISAEVFHESGQ